MQHLFTLLLLLIIPGLCAQTPIVPGEPVTGKLERGDARLTSEEPFDEFTFEGEAGQMISARMHSEDFDTYLIFIGADGYQQDNDDFAGELNSGIDLTLTASGTQRLLATSYSPDASGEYTLSLYVGSVILETPED